VHHDSVVVLLLAGVGGAGGDRHKIKAMMFIMVVFMHGSCRKPVRQPRSDVKMPDLPIDIVY
jgi:hypothetical protein